MEPPVPSFADRLRESAYAFALDGLWAGAVVVALTGGALAWAALNGADPRIVYALIGAVSAVTLLVILTLALVSLRRLRIKRSKAVIGRMGFIDRQVQAGRDLPEFLKVSTLLAAETRRIGDLFAAQTAKMESFKSLPTDRRLVEAQRLANQTAKLMDRRTVKFKERVQYYAKLGDQLISNQDEIIKWQLNRKSNTAEELALLASSSRSLRETIRTSRGHQEAWRHTLIGEEAATTALDAANQRLAAAISEGIAASQAIEQKLDETIGNVEERISGLTPKA